MKPPLRAPRATALLFPFFCLFLSFCVLTHARADDELHPNHWDRPTCKNLTLEAQKLPNFTAFNNGDFFRLYDRTLCPNGQPCNGTLYNSSNDMSLTLRGCQQFCGNGSWYWDAGPRLTTWIIPVLLLLSNIELSPIDKKRFMTILHAVGDPIDSFWSILHKIYIWRRLYFIGLANSRRIKVPPRGWRPKERQRAMHERARVIATVLSGFEEIAGSRIESEVYYHMICRQLGRIGKPNENTAKFEEWRRAARSLADARTNELGRTMLAIFVYVFGVIAALVDDVGGGNTTPPGGRIGSAIFLSWLVPLALLTNTVGTFTSRRTCLTIMRLFVARVMSVDQPLIRGPGGARPSPPAGGSEAQAAPTLISPFTSPDIDPMQKASQAGPSSPPAIRRKSVAPYHSPNLEAGPARPSSTPSPSMAFSRPAPIHEYDLESPEIDPREQADPHRQAEQPFLPGPAIDTRRLSVRDAIERRRVSSGENIELPAVAQGRQSNEADGRHPSAASSIAPLIQFSGEFGFESPLGPSDDEREQPARLEDKKIALIEDTTWNEYFQSLQWLGSIYTYRPWKIVYLDVHRQSKARSTNFIMVLGGVIPVTVSMAGAFAIIWYAVPEGFSCRHLWVLGIYFAWLLSAFITSVLYLSFRKKLSGHTIWLIVLAKDVVVGIGGLIVIFMSTAGLFNNCYCWTAVLFRGREGAYVPLNSEDSYNDYAAHLYSIVVGTSIGFQVIFYLGFMWWWRQGLTLVLWTETRRREEWLLEREQQRDWYSDENYLLFWYKEEMLEFQEIRRQEGERRWSVANPQPRRTSVFGSG